MSQYGFEGEDYEFDYLRFPDLNWSLRKRRRWCRRMFAEILAAGPEDDAQASVVEGAYARGDMDECNFVNLARVYMLIDWAETQDGEWPRLDVSSFDCDPVPQREVVAARLGRIKSAVQ